ncbi:M14 family metallopeptidase [Sinomicrobium sp.]
MKLYFTWVVIALLFTACHTDKPEKDQKFQTLFESSEGKQTPEYEEVIDYYKKLAEAFQEIDIQTMGMTDSGYPLHLVTYNPDGSFDFDKLRKDKRILLVLNGIHPGESDGIDASMMLLRDYAQGKLNPPKNTIIATIPVYNIGGALNRNSHTRANQNGPQEYGFRGNAKNYDLNRDFIKSDSRNSRAFAEIFQLVKPDVFIDNHVSNGADYQYTLTHLFTQHNKLGSELGQYLHREMMPQLEQALAEKDWNITPYVNVFNKPPETGFSQFADHPRYSTGYATLWNTLGMMLETHMLKPYPKRVEGTYQLLREMVNITEKDHLKIKELRQTAFKYYATADTYPVRWTVDSTKVSTLQFLGYEADTIISAVTGLPRLKYNRDKPFVKPVSYYNYFKASHRVTVPKSYVIPKQWRRVVELLKLNGVTLHSLPSDTLMEVQAYRIEDFKTQPSAFEGHYLHYNTAVSSQQIKKRFNKGDYIVQTDQPAIRYLIETLEPEASDSFFNWNFFDPILQQKEHFSPYVFEDIALELLENNPALKTEFEALKEGDSDFSKNWYEQLQWIYQHSEYYEKAHMQYPVYRILY